MAMLKMYAWNVYFKLQFEKTSCRQNVSETAVQIKEEKKKSKPNQNELKCDSILWKEEKSSKKKK